MATIIVRSFLVSDRLAVGELFYDCVHSINARDYSKAQLDIWAPVASKSGDFPRPLENNHSYVALIDNRIVGFADLTANGYLDRFFVHKDFQRQGVGKELLKAIESKAHELQVAEITLESSITALPFFRYFSYEIVEQQNKLILGELFINYKMKKVLV